MTFFLGSTEDCSIMTLLMGEKDRREGTWIEKERGRGEKRRRKEGKKKRGGKEKRGGRRK